MTFSDYYPLYTSPIGGVNDAKMAWYVCYDVDEGDNPGWLLEQPFARKEDAEIAIRLLKLTGRPPEVTHYYSDEQCEPLHQDMIEALQW